MRLQRAAVVTTSLDPRLNPASDVPATTGKGPLAGAGQSSRLVVGVVAVVVAPAVDAVAAAVARMMLHATRLAIQHFAIEATTCAKLLDFKYSLKAWVTSACHSHSYLRAT